MSRRHGGAGVNGQPTVVVADDQALVRGGFRMILNSGGIEVVAEAAGASGFLLKEGASVHLGVRLYRFKTEGMGLICGWCPKGGWGM